MRKVLDISNKHGPGPIECPVEGAMVDIRCDSPFSVYGVIRWRS